MCFGLVVEEMRMKSYVTEYECPKCHQLMLRHDELTVECPRCFRRLQKREAWNLFKKEDTTSIYIVEVKRPLSVTI